MNNKGFAISGIIYGILIVFLLLVFSVLGIVVNRKSSLDRVKENAYDTVLDKNVNDFIDNAITADWTTMYVPVGMEITNDICKGGAYSKFNYDISCVPGITTDKEGTGTIVFRVFSGSSMVSMITRDLVVTKKNTDPILLDYTGHAEQITLQPGEYKIELWGSQGGTCNSVEAGKGGYTSGILFVSQLSNYLINVGSGGGCMNPGYNGGGKGTPKLKDGTSYLDGAGGGGATDIRYYGSTSFDDINQSWDDTTGINNRIMVAGAGGGNGYILNNYKGGNAGGLNGSNGIGRGITINPGKQTTGFHLGLGQNGLVTTLVNNWDESGRSGGGAGYYGGNASQVSANGIAGGGGGSSYISGHTGCVAITSATDTTPRSGCTDGTTDINCSYHYSGMIFTDTVMKSGSEEMPTHDGTSTMTGNTGNGYAKITPYVYYK